MEDEMLTDIKTRSIDARDIPDEFRHSGFGFV
jgi:hypothetical protein